MSHGLKRVCFRGNGANFLKRGADLAVLLLGALGVVLGAKGTDWPEFRGPYGDGHAQGAGDTKLAGLPVRWSETENVKWKTAIPYRGWSTPVVMAGQVWLTTATADGHDFFAICVDAKTGQVLLNEKLFHSETPERLGNDMNSYATPSPVIEPGRVYLSFGSYGTACLDTATWKTLWKRDDLPCSHYRGPSSSPIQFDSLLILTMDGADLQYTVALDKATGQTVWKADRTALWNPQAAPGKNLTQGDFHKAHSTPLIANDAGRVLLLSADANAAYAYDARTGVELWRIHHSDFSVAPAPLFEHGVAFFCNRPHENRDVGCESRGTGRRDWHECPVEAGLARGEVRLADSGG